MTHVNKIRYNRDNPRLPKRILAGTHKRGTPGKNRVHCPFWALRVYENSVRIIKFSVQLPEVNVYRLEKPYRYPLLDFHWRLIVFSNTDEEHAQRLEARWGKFTAAPWEMWNCLARGALSRLCIVRKRRLRLPWQSDGRQTISGPQKRQRR